MSQFNVILDDKYCLNDLIDAITLEDSLNEIAYQASISCRVIPNFPQIKPGQKMIVEGIPFGGNAYVQLLAPGVVWECERENTTLERQSITCFDATIYLEKSEDEYLFPSGQTATKRLKQYAADWNIPLSPNIVDTKIPLSKAVYRSQSIYSMIKHDLIETVDKGGAMHRIRMSSSGLELVEIGTNQKVWILESENTEIIAAKSTLEGVITQVKILGNAGEDTRSPILAVVKGDTSKYGTLQKILQDKKIESTGAAKKAGEKLISGPLETTSISGIDINTIRAGDLVQVNQTKLIVCQIKHELGTPGKMFLELGDTDYVRRRFYGGSV